VTKMRRSYFLIFGAWLVHVAAWFLPVITDGVRFPSGLPGWQAFRTAASPVWPYNGGSNFSAIGAVAATLSALTTIIFLFGSPWIVLRGSQSLRRASAWVASVAFILDGHWYFFYGRNDSGLLIGYFLWWSSFLLLAIGLFALAGRNREASTKNQSG
jgi:hypothetical protein